MGSTWSSGKIQTLGSKGLCAFGSLLLALLPGLPSGPAFAAGPSPTELPTNGVVASGQASIMSGNAAMTINQTTDKAVINWSTFNVGSRAEVSFNQPSANSQTLNRVLGAEASQLYGKVKANGQVLLINPNGVVIGEGAQISASGVVASTLDITDQDFRDGNYRFERNGATGSVVNEGDVTTPATGYVALLGVNVSNRGSVTTGKAVLAAGDKVEIPVTESGLITLEAEAGVGSVDNAGTWGEDGQGSGQRADQGEWGSGRREHCDWRQREDSKR